MRSLAMHYVAFHVITTSQTFAPYVLSALLCFALHVIDALESCQMDLRCLQSSCVPCHSVLEHCQV